MVRYREVWRDLIQPCPVAPPGKLPVLRGDCALHASKQIATLFYCSCLYYKSNKVHIYLNTVKNSVHSLIAVVVNLILMAQELFYIDQVWKWNSIGQHCFNIDGRLDMMAPIFHSFVTTFDLTSLSTFDLYLFKVLILFTCWYFFLNWFFFNLPCIIKCTCYKLMLMSF